MPLSDDDRQWLSRQLDIVRNEVRTVRDEFSARLEKVETSLLTEFHKWASPVEMRQRSHAAALRALDAEVEALGDRVKGLEGT